MNKEKQLEIEIAEHKRLLNCKDISKYEKDTEYDCLIESQAELKGFKSGQAKRTEDILRLINELFNKLYTIIPQENSKYYVELYEELKAKIQELDTLRKYALTNVEAMRETKCSRSDTTVAVDTSEEQIGEPVKGCGKKMDALGYIHCGDRITENSIPQNELFLCKNCKAKEKNG